VLYLKVPGKAQHIVNRLLSASHAALSEKKEKKKYISELARELEISRPLLYLHLRKLKEVGILTGKTELGKGSRTSKYYVLCDFELCLDGKKIKEMLEDEEKKIKPHSAAQSFKRMQVDCRSKEDFSSTNRGGNITIRNN